MALDKVVSDTARLYCDDVGAADVEYTITVRRSGADHQTRASGFLRGDMDIVESCRKASVVKLATRHFGSVLIQIHRIDDFHAHFDVAEPLDALGVDPPATPDLASDGEEPEARGQREI